MATSYDPVAVEIHRRALENIVVEMGISLARTSGSPTVTDAGDFSTSLMDRNGEQLGVVAAVMLHAATAKIGVRTLIEDLAARGEKPRPGDGWLFNNPHWGGAQHQGDVGLIMPTFYKGELVGWSFANVHVADVGGVGVSGFAPGARSVYEEGLLLSHIRAITDGKLEEPWERYIASNVRVPGPVLNDIRSMIAANHTAQRKVVELLDQVGLERHEEYCRINADLTEQLLRQRIEKIPDGVYEDIEWTEYDGFGPDNLYQMKMRLVVEGSDLKFFLSGDPQVDAYINSPEGAVTGCLIASVVSMLCYGDFPFNAGFWRAIHIDLGPPGTIVNAVTPAPVSAAHAETGRRVVRSAKTVLAQAMSLSDDPAIRARVSGQNQDGTSSSGLFGVNQHGSPCVAWYMDNAVGMGGAAQTIMDGQDCYGGTDMAGCGMPDVETHEATDPVLFLWRKLVPNSGGPGYYRGGQGIEEAMAIAYTDSMSGFATSLIAEVPPSGVGGGFPAALSGLQPIHASNYQALLDRGEQPLEGNIDGRRDFYPNKVGQMTVLKGDVLVTTSGGGGGLGDPLLRDPAIVARDLRDGYITERHARLVYGVVADAEGNLDAKATEAGRAAIRKDRIGAAPAKAQNLPESPGVAVELSHASGKPRWTCACCGTSLCDADQDWRETGAVVRNRDAVKALTEVEMRIRERRDPPAVLLVEAFCPGCAACLSVDVTIEGVPVPSPRPAAVEKLGRRPRSNAKDQAAEVVLT